MLYAPDKIKQTQDELRAKGVKYCIGAYVDIHGVPKAKVVPLDHLAHMAHGSELYTGYALDGLGQAPNDDEIASVPDLDHIIQLPWEPKLAWMPADNTFRGEPYPLNTRVALKNVLAQAAELGFGFNLGIECEIFVLRQNADGTLSVPNPDDKLTKPCYDLRPFLDNFTWLDKVATCINDLGWDLYSFDHEDANGQYEFDFKYADALTMCDRLIFFRYMTKHYAKEEGLLATMMPKPFADKTGCGAHFNMSLYDLAGGHNLFAREPADDPRGLGLERTRLSFHRRHLAARPRAVRGLRADGQQLQAPRAAGRHELFLLGAGVQFLRLEQPHQFGARADGRRPLRIAQRRRRGQSLSRRDAGAGRRPRRHPRQDRSRQSERGQSLHHFRRASGARAASISCRRPCRRRSRPSPPTRWSKTTLGKELRDEFVKYKTMEWESYHLTVSQWEVERYSHLF